MLTLFLEATQLKSTGEGLSAGPLLAAGLSQELDEVRFGEEKVCFALRVFVRIRRVDGVTLL